MDPIQSIETKTDATFALLLEAQRRSWSVFYWQQHDLFMLDGAVYANMSLLKLQDHEERWFELGEKTARPLSQLKIILMRKDPPVDQDYIHTTQLLDIAEQAGVLVVNKPQSLRDFNEKLFPALFPGCYPPTLFTHSISAIKEFLTEQNDIICKPLDGMGGASVFRLTKNDPNINVILETLTQDEKKLTVAQRYIPAIKQGDKRILMIDGEPIPYALARLPAPGETRANLAAGGHGIGVKLSERDQWICQQVGPYLRKQGLLLVGLDVIGDYLTEINITSPTCIRELDRMYKLNISAQFLERIQDLVR